MERLIVDTGVLVALERGRLDERALPDDADIAVTTDARAFDDLPGVRQRLAGR